MKDYHTEFKIIECTPDRIVVNREPQTPEEELTMRLAVTDARTRDVIEKGTGVIYPKRDE